MLLKTLDRVPAKKVTYRRFLFRLGLSTALALFLLKCSFLCIEFHLLLQQRLADGSGFLLNHLGYHLLHRGRREHPLNVIVVRCATWRRGCIELCMGQRVVAVW